MGSSREHFVRKANGAQRRHRKERLARGIRLGKDRVQKLMRLHGIRARGKRRFKVTADNRHDLPISPNLLNRQFTASEPNRV
jgi:putative transposase